MIPDSILHQHDFIFLCVYVPCKVHSKKGIISNKPLERKFSYE